MQIQVKRTTQSTTWRVLIVGILALLSSVGVRLAVEDEQIDQIAEAIGVAAPFIAMGFAAIFRRSNNVVVPAQVQESIERTYGTTTLQVTPQKDGAGPFVPAKGTPYPGDRSSSVSPRSYPAGPSSSTGPGTPLVSLLMTLLCLFGAGCMSRAEHRAQMDLMDRASSKIHSEHRLWARELVKPPSERDGQVLPNLHDGETEADRANWLKARESWHEEYRRTLQENRANDGPAQPPQ